MKFEPIGLVSLGIRLWIKICSYLTAVNKPSIFSNFPTPLEDVQPSTLIQTSSMLNCWLQTGLFLSLIFFHCHHFDPGKWNFDTSVQSIIDHCSFIQFLCICAYFSLSVLFPFLNGGFPTITHPLSPDLKSDLRTDDGRMTPEHSASPVVNSTLVIFLFLKYVIFNNYSSLLDSFLSLLVLDLSITDDVFLYLFIVLQIPHLEKKIKWWELFHSMFFHLYTERQLHGNLRLNFYPFCLKLIIILKICILPYKNWASCFMDVLRGSTWC